MTAEELERWIEANYAGLNLLDTYGELSFFYNPDNILPKGVYFATIKTMDGPNDKASNLKREDIYRLSFGIGRKNYNELFGDVPERPTKGEVVDLDIDFEEENVLMPHPIYSWISWVNILTPSREKLTEVKWLIDFAYNKAVGSYNQKMKKIAEQKSE